VTVGRKFHQPTALFIESELRLFYKYTLGTFARLFLGKHTDHKQQNTIRFHILIIDK